MRYTTIIKYYRDGNKLIPVRESKFYGQTFNRELTWPELFGNHTSWVAEEIKRYNERYQRA